MLSLFVSSAVFKELVEALPQLWYCLSVISGENFENFSDISAISEEIYFRLPQFNDYQKGEAIQEGWVTNKIFLTKLCPSFVFN